MGNIFLGLEWPFNFVTAIYNNKKSHYNIGKYIVDVLLY